jgi:hypothetical protein
MSFSRSLVSVSRALFPRIPASRAWAIPRTYSSGVYIFVSSAFPLISLFLAFPLAVSAHRIIAPAPAAAAPVDNPEYPDILTGAFGTMDNPVKVPSYNDERIIGCEGMRTCSSVLLRYV